MQSQADDHRRGSCAIKLLRSEESQTMFLCRVLEPSGKKKNRLICDQCGIVFEKRKLIPGRKHHFHNKECWLLASRSGGILVAAMEETNLERYGDKCSLKNPSVKEKRRLTWLETLGVETTPFENKGVQARASQTFWDRHHVRGAADLPHVKEKIRSPESQEKRMRTLQTNNGRFSSAPESMLYDELVARFGASCVERNVFVNGWSIDLAVMHDSTKIFIQLDGIYWHGLDRPLDVIAAFKTVTDRIIHRKFMTDRKQDEWFSMNDIHLVRITDAEINDAKKGDTVDELLVMKLQDLISSTMRNNDAKA